MLLFGAFEINSGLLDIVDLQYIRYYALRDKYLPDPSLVFVYRHTGVSYKSIFFGDLYSPLYGVEYQETEYVGSYNDLGFRSNSSGPPFEVAVIGDSFIEFGETDFNTMSEKLNAVSGLSTFNLGRSFYGPYQYVELLKRYGLAIKPKYALFCFFAGNDIEDIQRYRKWLGGGGYDFYYDFSRKSFFGRYRVALSDTVSFLSKYVKSFLSKYVQGRTIQTDWKKQIHPDLGLIRLGDKKVRMRFLYWNQHASAEQLLSSEEWQALKSLLIEFKRLSIENGITPVIVFIPSKIQVYGDYYTHDSGQYFLSKIEGQLAFQSNSADALNNLAQDLGILMVNLLPYFKHLAGEGKVLYYPFDTHWNPEGRQEAAEFIAVSLGWNVAKNAHQTLK